MPPPGKAPKPKWKEMVAPYEGEAAGATIRNHLRHAPGWVWACRWQCRCMKAIPLTPFIERYGADITFPELLRRMRCATCGDHPSSVSLPTTGPGGEYRFPPLDRVPKSLSAYAKIDPTHLPAPMRGPSQSSRVAT